jgi:PTS system mannose-specific IIA component
MIGVLIVTHGNLSTGLMESVELIMGKQEKVKTLTLHHGDNVEVLKGQIKKDIEELNDGDGVIVLTDVFGGSPTNATVINMQNLEFQAITGVNLPMLLETFCLREEMDLEPLTKHLVESGKEGIKDLKEALNM